MAIPTTSSLQPAKPYCRIAAAATPNSGILHSLRPRSQQQRGQGYVRCSNRRLAQDIIAASATKQVEAPAPAVEWLQKTITLPAKSRGCHVMTREVTKQVPELTSFEVGMVNFFILHTSASLTINENASPDVPLDLNDSLDRIAPEGNHYRHLDEGYDDMPAHVKSSLMGASLDIPLRHGKLALGTWQGIYLNEHRNYGGSRQVVVTVHGQKSDKQYSQWS